MTAEPSAGKDPKAVRNSIDRSAALLTLAAGWVWEQDAEFRFTALEGVDVEGEPGSSGSHLLGKCRWDGGLHLVDLGGWSAHRRLLQARRPFRDVVMYRVLDDGSVRYVAVSGDPIFNADQEFLGYHGIGRDITAQRQDQEELATLRAAVDACPDHIFVVDPEAMRFLYVNSQACRALGYPLDGYRQISPEQPTRLSREELTRVYRKVAKSGDEGLVTPPVFVAAENTELRGWWELHRRARRAGERDIIVTIARDVTSQKLADDAVQRAKKMLAAISETNEAILRVASATELYQRVCDAAVQAGEFAAAVVLLFESENEVPVFAAGAGRDAEFLRRAPMLVDLTTQEGMGTVGIAFRTGETCIVDDFAKDARVRAWHKLAEQGGVKSSAAVPLLRRGRPFGVLLLCATSKRAFDREIVELLERMTENIAFALDNFEREAERERAEEALRASEEKYRSILESIEDAYYEVDIQGNLVTVNPAFCRMLGYSESELVGKNNRELMRQDSVSEVCGVFNRVYRTGMPMRAFEWEMLRKDGKRVLTEASIQLIRDDSGAPAGFRGILRDVTERKREESLSAMEHAVARCIAEAESTNAALQAIIGIIGETEQWQAGGYFVLDAQAGRMQAAIGWSSGPASGTAALLYRQPLDPEGPAAELLRAVQDAGKPLWLPGGRERPWGDAADRRGYFAFPVRSGARVIGMFIFAGVPWQPEARLLETVAAIGAQVGQFLQRKEAEERVQYLASHDSLTGFPNRVLFSQVLNVAINTAQRYGRQFAVMFIDLDRFKLVNDTLGHEAGDILLKEIALRLKETVRTSDFVARLGGDEFVVLLQEINSKEDAAVVARKILAAAIEPVEILGHECRVTASIGICLYPSQALDEQALMKNADIAMYLAKEEGKNTYQFYSPHTKTQSFERLALESSLRSALERNEFLLHYQPKLDLKTGEITGVEALLRWNHPQIGMIPPNQFIPLAEETGIIVAIGRWVLKTACAQNMAWQRQGLPAVDIAVNISPRQFADESLVGDIAEALHESGMPAELLELELTEGMVMQNPERAVRLLKELKAMGIRIAMDDFGVGYSSLAQLKGFPIDTLKVDRSFIRNLPESDQDRAITEAIIAMAKTLSLVVVAEGVETEAQEIFLRNIACDESQGYYFSKPIAADAFAKLLRTHETAVSG